MIKFDHMKLVRRDVKEMKRLRGFLLGLQRGEVHHMSVLHEHDDSCCRKEPWSTTISVLSDAMIPAGNLAD